MTYRNVQGKKTLTIYISINQTDCYLALQILNSESKNSLAIKPPNHDVK